MDIYYPALIKGAFTYGDYYVMVWPVDELPEETSDDSMIRVGVELTTRNPKNTRVIYDPENERKKWFAIQRFPDRTDREIWHADLFYVDRVERWISVKGQALDRVHSRIGARAHCTGATSKDIAALLDAWDISDRAARSIVSDIARRPGARRAATKVIRSAHLYAAGGAIGAEHLRAARAGRGI
jgi:hypothetical protein